MRLLLTILYLTFSAFAFNAVAQAYEPGLIVRSTGDTLRGEIENSFWVNPPTYIRYRTGPNAPSQLFQPRQLRAVRFTGGRYFRYEVLALDHAAQTELTRLPQGNVIDVETDSLLADVLVDGPGTLLRAGVAGTMHYVFRRPGKPDLDVCARQYLRRTDNGANTITDGNNYRSQLQLYFLDCPAASALAQTAPYTPEALGAIVQAYNQSCTPARAPGRSWLAQAKPRRKYSFQGGLLAGIRYNRIEGPDYALPGACTDCKAHPFGGVYAELLQPNRQLAIYGEFSLSSFRSRVANFNTASSTFYNYRALLGTARMGVRTFVPLANERQLLFGFGYEINTVFMPRDPDIANQPLALAGSVAFATPTLLPNLTVGWRTGRLTLSLDGQLYHAGGSGDGYSSIFFDNAGSARLGVAYRLGGNPDAVLTGK